jgi:ABC-type branched-subunit amino acid transport system substrate-binding protein
MYKKFWLLVFCLLPITTTRSTSAEDTSLPKIALIAPLTGPFATVQAQYDIGQKLAAEDQLGPFPWEWVLADSQADATKAISEYQRVVHASNVIGLIAQRSPVGMALNPMAKRDQIPFLGIVGNNLFPQQSPYSFQLWPNSDQEGKFFANFASQQGWKKLAILTAEDDYLVATSKAFIGAATAQGSSIAFSESVLPSENDFLTIIRKLRSLDLDSILILLAPAQSGVFARQFRAQNTKLPIVSSFFIANSDALAAAGPGVTDGIYYSEISSLMPKLQARAEALGEKNLSGMMVVGYVTTRLLMEAFQGPTPPDSKEKLFAALLAVKQLQIPDATLAIEDRRVIYPMVIKRLMNGKGVLYK